MTGQSEEGIDMGTTLTQYNDDPELVAARRQAVTVADRAKTWCLAEATA